MDAQKEICIRSPDNLIFSEGNHIYTVDGVNVPSTTTIIKKGDYYGDYDSVPPHVLKRAGDIGTEVHRVAECWANGESDLTTDDKSAMVYLSSLWRWVDLGVFTPLYSELMLYHPEHWYAGTVDLVGVMVDGRPCVVDIKTTNKLNVAAVELQLAAYEKLIGFWDEESDRIFDRFVLLLNKEDRIPVLHKCDDPRGWLAFEKLIGK